MFNIKLILLRNQIVIVRAHKLSLKISPKHPNLLHHKTAQSFRLSIGLKFKIASKTKVVQKRVVNFESCSY